MRRKSQRSFWLATVLTPLLLLGAGSVDEVKEADDGLDVYFREADLLALTSQALPVYPDSDAGESTKLGRDFPDAPPQIPHTVDDMYPLTIEENECLDCHDPENAVSKEDVPLPGSHFEAPVMGEGKAGDPMIWVVKEYQKRETVAGTRYNCSMCHTPQATNVDTPSNLFVAARKRQKQK